MILNNYLDQKSLKNHSYNYKTAFYDDFAQVAKAAV